MQSIFEITKDMQSVVDLIDKLEDEDGNSREPTEEENRTLYEWLSESKDNFDEKFDNYNKIIKNFSAKAELADAERKALKDEMDRLSARSKTASNKVTTLKNALRYCMEALGRDKWKTALFSANIQNIGGKTVQCIEGADYANFPDDYLKPREVNTKKILEDIKNGVLTVKPDGRIFYADFEDEENAFLPYVRAVQPRALVLR